jgi:hypothetical protein
MAAAAMALGGAAIAVAAPAAPAETAAPVTIQAWQIYGVYRTYDTCSEVGKALVRSGDVLGWRCEWDSPFFALYVRY